MLDFVAVHGLRVAFRRRGQGKPVVLLHGGMSDSREWHAALADLGRDHDVIALDALGSGGSADPPEGFGIRDHADLLAGALTALGVPAAHVVGLSLGSIFALALYHEHPEMVRSMVLEGAYAGWAGSLPSDEVDARIRMVLATLERPVEEWGPPFLATVFGDRVPPAVVEESMALLRDVRPEASRRLVLTFGRADLRAVLPTITVPVLLVYGQLDQRAPRAVAEQMHAGIPGSALVVVPGVGHAVHLEAPPLFNSLVREFVGSVAVA